MPHFSVRHRLLYSTLSAAFALSLYSCAPKTVSTEPTAPAPGAARPKAAAELAAEVAKRIAEPPYSGQNLPGGGSVPGNPYGFVKPDVVKGIYLTAWSAGSPKKRKDILQMIDGTELNTVVIDVRDTGEMYFNTGIPLAKEVEAYARKTEGSSLIAIVKPEKLFSELAAHHVWPIARVACFRDNYVPKLHPDMAVQTPDHKVWKDRSGHSWLDPYNHANWDYIAQTVEYAMQVGFPEIQLDYVRFPSEGKAKTQVFLGKKTYPDKTAKPEDVIAAFCKYIRTKVKAHGDYFSADIFGIVSSTHRDQGIGQELEKLAAPFDVVSPMVYPSHFHKGEYGIADPNKQPYAILQKSLRDYKLRVPTKPVRPWLQDFSLFHVHYGPAEVRAQIKAANDLGYKEWLLWNAGNRYTESALLKKGAPGNLAKAEKSAT